MYSKETSCKKITRLYPDIGTCGINVDVAFDEGKKVWVVDLKKGELNVFETLGSAGSKKIASFVPFQAFSGSLNCEISDWALDIFWALSKPAKSDYLSSIAARLG